ncbi:transposase [Streptomyces sp. NPDC127079]|uniref:transposase n=1 Tax=Streptomyces sp. NPDC127079 TaxID=3347132 RepID=UPI00365AB42E
MAAPRKYSLELRERAVRMYRTTEPKPQIKKLAVDLGVHPEALRGWIRQAEADAGERDDRLSTDERAELVALRRENAQLKRANDVLRTASAPWRLQRIAAETPAGETGTGRAPWRLPAARDPVQVTVAASRRRSPGDRLRFCTPPAYRRDHPRHHAEWG